MEGSLWEDHSSNSSPALERKEEDRKRRRRDRQTIDMILINSLLPIVRWPRFTGFAMGRGPHPKSAALNLGKSSEEWMLFMSLWHSKAHPKLTSRRADVSKVINVIRDKRWAAAAPDDYHIAIWKKFCGCLDTANYEKGVTKPAVRPSEETRVIFTNASII